MQTRRHTRTPWEIKELESCPLPAYGYQVQAEARGRYENPWPVALVIMPADADLVAAAPELLDACRAFQAWWHGSHSTPKWVDLQRTVALTQAAIAKAEGRT